MQRLCVLKLACVIGDYDYKTKGRRQFLNDLSEGMDFSFVLYRNANLWTLPDDQAHDSI
jgi:hypothetical protein